jgi:hypothetical protein
LFFFAIQMSGTCAVFIFFTGAFTRAFYDDTLIINTFEVIRENAILFGRTCITVLT